MPIAPPNSPLLDLMYNLRQVGDTCIREDMMESKENKKQDFLGTFFIQAIFLSLAIMLYATWEWSQFGEPWEAALFYGLLSFSLQAALYFTYRTMFEDSSNYRKELKRMKNKQRKRMAQMSFEMRKMQTETLLTQQMQQYQQQMALANADGYIDQHASKLCFRQQLAVHSANGGWRGKRPRPRENGEAIGNRPIQGGAHSSRSKVNFIPRTYNQHAHSGKLAEPEPQPRVEYRLASPRDSGMRCQALTADKAQCKRYSDEQFCWQHRPKQPRKVSKVRSGDMDKVLTV